MSQSVLARKVGTKTENVLLWEAGEKRPTFNQAMKIADATNTPFGFLYLAEPPVEELPIPDLRTVGSAELRTYSLNLRDVLRDALIKQAWLIDYLKANGEDTPLSFVGRFRTGARVSEIVADMKRVLRKSAEFKGSSEEYYTNLVRSAEDCRVIVLRSGVVGSNTHRKLDVSEFRGFSIVDKLAPVVFINSCDAPSARLFTLVHELAHLWIGQGGISDTAIKSTNKIEKTCNAVAGEFLVPSNVMQAMWDEAADWLGEVQRLAHRFHVSKLVVARRAKDLGFISAEDYRSFYDAELKSYRRKNEDKSGGDPYRTAAARNSALISKLVLDEALSGRMLLREAGGILGVRPSNLAVLARKLEL